MGDVMKMLALAVAALLGVAAPGLAAASPRNVALLVPDGLRGAIVDDATGPAMVELARQGVWMRNSHSLFPTFATADTSAIWIACPIVVPAIPRVLHSAWRTR